MIGPRNQATYKLTQDSVHVIVDINGQYQWPILTSTIKRDEVGPLVCPILENPVLVDQESGHTNFQAHTNFSGNLDEVPGKLSTLGQQVTVGWKRFSGSNIYDKICLWYIMLIHYKFRKEVNKQTLSRRI